MGFTLSRINEYATANIREQELAELDLYAQRVSAQFDSLAQIALTTANLISLNTNLTEEDFYNLLIGNVTNNSLVFGAAIALISSSRCRQLNLPCHGLKMRSLKIIARLASPVPSILAIQKSSRKSSTSLWI